MTAEVTDVHTRILRCTLEADNARAWWAHPEDTNVAERAFAESWFGVRSLPRVQLLVANMRHRFDGYPRALAALRAWRHMDPQTRVLICHWHEIGRAHV